MYFVQVYLRGVKGCFTWESQASVNIGDLVAVNFRKKEKVGIVIDITKEKPEFKTQPVIEVCIKNFITPIYIEIAKEISEETFSSIEKVLSIMVPEKFFTKESPVKMEDGKIKIPKYLQKVIRENNFELTPLQQSVYEKIIESKLPTLLFGVTGSGKTEIYKKLAKNTDGQIIFLLPEIALTPQLIAEFKNVFGLDIAIWHSNLSKGEKVQEWARITTGAAKILVGTRSAIMLPLKNPKCIILDEEHEWTYKNESAPRYQTHEVAEKIAQKFGAKLLLGSATPRIESFKKVADGDWNLVELNKRVFETKMPKIEIIDLKNEGKKGNYGLISEKLDQAISETLAQKKQIVLFLNKRGFSSGTFCKHCGKEFHCPSCEVNLKHHKDINHGRDRLLCHFCGHMEFYPKNCPDCKKEDFEIKGWGTQQLESFLKEKYKDARIIRADADTMTKKHDFQNMIQDFQEHKADILLGTQMIAKGLDFEKVNLVGIVLADIGLTLPDFRTEERIFQLLMQVSGRAGRKDDQGRIFIQTFHPDEAVFDYIKNYKTNDFFKWQMQERTHAQMPPFKELCKITISNPSKTIGLKKAQNLLKEFKELQLPQTEIFMAPAFFPKLHKKYHFHVFIRSNTKKEIVQGIRKIKTLEDLKIDMYPISLL